MTTHDDFTAIAQLDLDPIKVKLMHKESGEGWSLEQANAIEFEYRRFLILMKKYPTEQTAPLFDVDIFWHYHILDTQKYAIDCDTVFGYFLHHFPYIGLRGEDDEAAHIRVGQRMKQLYETTFGEDYLRGATEAAAPAAAWSGVATRTSASGAQANTAWSGGAVRTAASDSGANTAWSGAAQTAASSAEAKTAWSGVAVRTADAGVEAKTAWSGVATRTAQAGRTAFSGMATQIAFSGVAAPVKAQGTQATAWSGVAVRAGAAHAKQEQSGFYSERPRLPAA